MLSLLTFEFVMEMEKGARSADGSTGCGRVLKETDVILASLVGCIRCVLARGSPLACPASEKSIALYICCDDALY